MPSTLLIAISPEPAHAASTACASGYTCLWTGSAYTGTMAKFSSTGTYLPAGLSSVGSYYNNRSRRAWIHEYADGSGRYVCVNPRVKVSLTAGWVTRAKAVYLSTITYC